MPPKFYPTRGHLLLCQGNSCEQRGAALLYKALWNHLERGGLAYYKQGGTVRLTSSGCLGACSYGPTLCVYRQMPGQIELPGQVGLEEAWYGAVDFPLAARIAAAVQEGAALPGEQQYGPLFPEGSL